MSFINKLFKTIKDTTGIDAGEITSKVQQTASFASMSEIAKGLCQLNWRWSKDAMMEDKGSGKPLRNWDRQTKTSPRLDDIYLNWETQNVTFDEYLVFIGWQGWPYAIIEKDHPEGVFLPEFVENLAKNNFNSVKYITVNAAEVPNNCIKFPASETDNEFYYVKLIGKTGNDEYYDVKGCTLASEYQREKQGFGPVPSGDIHEVKVPDGGRERNDLEKQLIATARQNKKR